MSDSDLMMTAQKPLLLKDYLELDYEFDFKCGRRSDGATEVTVRYLIDSELRRCSSAGSVGRLVRSRSMSALTKISAVINAVKLFSFPSTSSSNPRDGNGEGVGLSRSLSKKIKGSFCKKKKRATAAAAGKREGMEEKSKVVKRVRDIVRLKSFDEETIKPRRSYSLPSPVVASSRSNWSEMAASSRAGSSPRSSFASSANLDVTTTANNNTATAEEAAEVGGAAGDRAQKDMKGHYREFSDGCRSEEEEKDQLSPVSVMDFPFEEEDEYDDSPAFDETLANIDRTKIQLLQKIRRFESLAGLGPIDLQQRFDEAASCNVASSEDGHVEEEEEEEDLCRAEVAWDLLSQLKSGCHLSLLCGAATEKLLLDFFIQRMDSSGDGDCSRQLLSAAMDWVHGECDVAEDDWLYGDAAIREMEENGRWRCSEEEKEEIGMEVERVLMGRLLEDLMIDFIETR